MHGLVLILLGGAAVIYFTATEALDWAGRFEYMQSHFPRLLKWAERRTPRTVLLFVGICLLGTAVYELKKTPQDRPTARQDSLLRTPEMQPSIDKDDSTKEAFPATPRPGDGTHMQQKPRQAAPRSQQHPEMQAPPNPQTAPVTINAPNGIAIGGGTVTNPTVNNYSRPDIVYSYDGSQKYETGPGLMSAEAHAPNPLVKQIQTEIDTGNQLKALSDARLLMKSDPMWATPHLLAALSYFELGKNEAAKTELERARGLIPSGYKFEDDYEPHFRDMEELLERHGIR